MTTRDNDGVSKGHKASHAAKLRGGTPVANTRSDKTTNATLIKSKETVTERQREKTRWNTEKDDENVENISHDKVENLQPGEDKNDRKKSLLYIICIVVAFIAVCITLCPHLFPNPLSEPEKPLKAGPGDIHTQQEFINGLSKRLSIVESRLSDVKKCTCTDDTPNIDENLKFENRVIKSESDLSGEVNANKEELKDLKDEVMKLKDQIDVKFGDIKNVQEEHKALQAEVLNLNKKLGQRSQFVEQRNAEVSQQMLQHNETLRDLNLHVEYIGSTLKILNDYVKGQVITSLSDMLGNITANNMETEILKDKVQKINEGLQSNVTTLERKLGELLQSAEKKHFEMMLLMLQQNETLNGLVVSVEKHDSSLHRLDVSVTSHGTNLNNLKVSVERLQTNVTTLERKLGEQTQSAVKKNIEMMQIMLQHSETLNGLVASVEKHGSNLHSLDVSVTKHGTNLHNLNVSVENISSNLNIINVSLEGHDSTLRSLNVSVKTLDSSLLSLKDFADSLDSSLRSLNVSVENHVCNISDLNESVDNLRSNVKNITENITGISIETLVLDKRTEHIADNIFDKGSLIVVIMIITTLLVLVIIYLVASRNTKRHLGGIVDSQQQQSPAPYSTAGRILSQVQANLRLERKLCVLSFYEETHPLHMRMTQSVTQQLNQELEEFIIRRHGDILECPPVSLYFLFVDFNERNVILEDPTLGLGDLRLTTVQAVQKMGGKIVIFYVRDQNSRHLNPMKLYNEDLASVTKQRELSALSRLCRFISAYDQFTDNQKAHLRQIVLHELCSH